jgi:phage tail-like protein
MRGLLPDLPSAHPLGELLPAIYRADPFTQDLCAALDEVMATVLTTLDNFPAYLDPDTVPVDMLPWLAQWVGVRLPAVLPGDHHRSTVRSAAERYARHGTRQAVQAALQALLVMPVDVLESGGAVWSADPDAALPGSPVSLCVVVVHPGPGQSVDLAEVDAALATLIPAHVAHRVDVEPPPAQT